MRFLTLLALLLFSSAHAEDQVPKTAFGNLFHTRPMVVELYTSQGCSSCPPADAFLAELSKDPDILALSFHVDYWDYEGWKDPFSLEQATNRQRLYNRVLGVGGLFTPQMVVEGYRTEVGSKQNAVRQLIQDAKFNAPTIPVRFSYSPERAAITVHIAGADDGLFMENLPQHADVWLATVNRGYETRIDGGENVGKILKDVNVVTRLDRLTQWHRRTLVQELDARNMRSEGVAIIVQEENQGRILGAGLQWFTR